MMSVDIFQDIKKKKIQKVKFMSTTDFHLLSTGTALSASFKTSKVIGKNWFYRPFTPRKLTTRDNMKSTKVNNKMNTGTTPHLSFSHENTSNFRCVKCLLCSPVSQ